MERLNKHLAFGLLLFFTTSARSQILSPVQRFRAYCLNNKPPGYSPRFNTLTLQPSGNLHFLFPFYYAFKEEEKFRNLYPNGAFDDLLSQYFTFAGDYGSALQTQIHAYDSVDEDTRRRIYRSVSGLKDIVHADARKYIRFRARTSRVIMLNEAHDKPQHRVFVLSLLGDLHQEGYRYLAMEMLDNGPSHQLNTLDIHTGYFCAEPVAGELIRTALSLGFTLVSYEDTAGYRHTPNQRDSIQALNLWNKIRQDPGAKMLVLAGYAHISKKRGTDGYMPMGLAFRQVSGIDPLTIDQTDMTEESNFGYGRLLYQDYIQKYPLSSPSIPMVDNQPVNVTNNDLYDLAIIHPPTQYEDGRPTWLSMGGLRKPVTIKPTTGCFFVQAYYQEELASNDNKPWHVVPADQTWNPTSKNNYVLYLRRGKYLVYFRDMDYRVLGTLPIEVN